MALRMVLTSRSVTDGGVPRRRLGRQPPDQRPGHWADEPFEVVGALDGMPHVRRREAGGSDRDDLVERWRSLRCGCGAVVVASVAAHQ